MIQRFKTCLKTLGLILTCTVGLAAPSAEAQTAPGKTVAVLFDTSVSMNGRYQMPSFGARMLAATIDGNAGFDRMLVMNFNEYFTELGNTIAGVDSTMKSGSAPSIDRIMAEIPNAVRDIVVANGTQHQQVVTSLEDFFKPTPNISTPYGPIDVMLKRIEDDIKPGEEVIFVIISDGEYNSDAFKNGGLIPRMQQTFGATRDRITAKGGTLSVQYLFIDTLGGSQLRDTVREQGVRDTLLSVFNGDPAIGSKYVSNADELWEALQDIIAEVAGTDRAAQSQFITYQGNTISLNTPLSISRVVTVATGPVDNVPRLSSTTFTETPTETRVIETAMGGTDEKLGNPRRRGGVVEHLYFQRAVPAGDYVLTFNSPVDDEVFLLFETRAINQLQIFDQTGTLIRPVAGEYRLFVGQDYEFRSQIVDGAATPLPVDFATLPSSLTMSLTLSDNSGLSTASMTLDDTTDTGRFAWTPRAPGEIAATSRASAGVLSPRSETLKITVLDSSAELTVSDIQQETPCVGCAAGEINFPINAQGGVPVARFDVTAKAEMDGQITFRSSELPPGTELRDDTGAVVALDTPVNFAAGTTRQFKIWRTRNVAPEDIAKGFSELVVVVEPTGDWGGQVARTQTRPRVATPDMEIELVDVTQSITPGAIDGLMVPAGELLRGNFSAQFSLRSLLTPPDPDQIDTLVQLQSQGAMSRLVTLTPSFPSRAATGVNALEIRPESSFWCLCWIGAANYFTGTETRDVTVQYTYTVSGTVLQQASTTVPFAYPVRLIPQGGLSCALNLLYAVLTWIFLRAIWAFFATHRFPKGSLVEINRGSSAPSFRRLDKGHGLWWRMWFAAFTGNPDQTKTIEGLRMRATHKGAIVNVAKTTPPWTLERLDASFQELKETQPKKTEHRLQWGDRLDSTFDPNLSMRLKRRRGD